MSYSHDDQHLIRYLLGSLPDSEAERLDELSVADDEFVSRLSAAENELVDTYVRGGLSGDALRQFQTHYLATPARREKVRFAETLRLREIRDTAPSARAPMKSSRPVAAWRSLTAPGFIPARALAGAVALALVAAGYLIVSSLRLQRDSTLAQSQRASPGSLARDPQKQLEQPRPTEGALPKEAQGGGEAPEKSEPQRIASLLLVPQTRGPGRAASIAVPPGTDALALRLELETDEFPRYRAALKAAASSRIRWRSEDLKSSREGGRRVVRIHLPAALLPPGHHSVELTGITREGAAELLSTYAFVVVRELQSEGPDT